MTDYIKERLNWASEKDRSDAIHSVKLAGTSVQLFDKLRQMVPKDQVCSAVCDGKACKYCNPDLPEDKTAIKGLDAQWVTENIMACNRPNTRRMKEFNIVERFESLNIKSVLNLQEIGEHSECGDPLEEDSGFSYNPADFMQTGIYVYNYPIPDFGIPLSDVQMIDIMKVMQHAITLGKIAIHCHAGRGRTGMVIACYLIYNNRLSTQEAIAYVRKTRTGAIQTQDQVDFILKFSRFLEIVWVIYELPSESNLFAANSRMEAFSLEQFLGRQALLLKGNEVSTLRHIPKILYILVQRILQLTGIKFSLRKLYSSLQVEYSEDANASSSGSLKTLLEALVSPYTIGMETAPSSTPKTVEKSAVNRNLIDMQKMFNNDVNYGKETLAQEGRADILSDLLWSWLDQLSDPVFRFTEVDAVCRSDAKSAATKLRVLNNNQSHTFLLFASFLKLLAVKANLVASGESDEKKLLDVLALRILTHLTHSSFPLEMLEFIRSEYSSVASCASGTTAVNATPVDAAQSRPSTASSMSNFSEISAAEPEQTFSWTVNAAKLRHGHKRRLIRLLVNFIKEVKTRQLSDGQPTAASTDQAPAVAPVDATAKPATENGKTPAADASAPVVSDTRDSVTVESMDDDEDDTVAPNTNTNTNAGDPEVSTETVGKKEEVPTNSTESEEVSGKERKDDLVEKSDATTPSEKGPEKAKAEEKAGTPENADKQSNVAPKETTDKPKVKLETASANGNVQST